MPLLRDAQKYPTNAPSNTNAPTTCEIRVLETVSELIDAYRLRHEVYGALGYLQRHNTARLEVDEYDSTATPFGAFDPDSGLMVGALRLITIKPQPQYGDLVRRLVTDVNDPDLTRQALGPRPHVLPSIISDEIEHQIAAFNGAAYEVYELSRTIVHPTHRGSGVARALMELGLAHASRTAPAVLIGSCLAKHLPLYARYGYLKVPQTDLAHFDSVGQSAHACICRTDRLPEPTRSHVGALTRSMNAGDLECTLEGNNGTCVRYHFVAPPRLLESHAS